MITIFEDIIIRHDDFVYLLNRYVEPATSEKNESLVKVIEAVLLNCLDAQEPPTSDEQIRAKQNELYEKITGNSRESEAVESDDVDRSLSEPRKTGKNYH